MKNAKRLVISSLPLIYMGLIWYLSSYPADAVINTGLSFDLGLKEFLHLVEFAGLYVLLVLVLLTWDRMNEKSSIIIALIAIAYGFVDETHQYFVPNRSATIIDLVKNIIGVTTAWYVIKRSYFDKDNSKIKALLNWIAACRR
ncbi:MAG: VanZ family protein [Bacillota bacterium]